MISPFSYALSSRRGFGVRLGVPEEGVVKTGKYYQKIPPLRSSPYKGDIHRSAGFIRNNSISKVSGFI